MRSTISDVSYDFTYDGYDDPGPDVLDNRLPKLPQGIDVHHGLAVARWIDGDFGIVLHVYRDEPDDHGDEYNYDVQSYLRVDGVWEFTNGSGGSGWYAPPFERYPELNRFAVSGGHIHQQSTEDGVTIRVVDGIAGEGVVSTEVQTEGRTTSRPIESPVGARVVGVVGDAPAQWVARDGEGRVAASGEIEIVDFGMPAWVREQMPQIGGGETESGDGIEMGVWTSDVDEMSSDLAAWFERRNNMGHLPGETYIESDRQPQWQRLAHDLRQATGRELRILAYPSVSMPDAIEYQVWLDGALDSTHCRGFDEEDSELFLVEFTDLMCEQVLHEAIWGGWPTCPVHKTHPLAPVVQDDLATWACPKDAVSIRIGDITNEFLA